MLGQSDVSFCLDTGHLVVGGTDPAVIAEFWQRYRIPVLQNYGATEFSGSVAGWTLKDFHKCHDAKVGSVISLAPVAIGDRAQVSGFVRSQGSITRGNGSTVSGAQVASATVALANLSNFGVLFPDSTLGDVRLEPNQTRTIAPGPYGTLSVKSGAKVFLRSGTYSFDTIELEPNGRLVADKSSGPVYIYVRVRLSLQNESTRVQPLPLLR